MLVPDNEDSNPQSPQAQLMASGQTAMPKIEVGGESYKKSEDENEQEDKNESSLVKEWNEKINAAKKYHEKIFKRMAKDMDFIEGKQWSDSDTDDRYVANISHRHIQQRVASLYAKNPTVVVTRRKTMDFELWDEKRSSLVQLTATVEAGKSGMLNPEDPNQFAMISRAEAMLQDITRGTAQRAMLEKIARTLECAFENIIDTQEPNFKKQMKQMVRRTLICSVGFVKLGYKRKFEKRPDDVQRVNDITERIAQLNRIIEEMGEGDITEPSAEIALLKVNLADLANDQDQIVEDGVIYDFPRSAAIIIDPNCSDIRTFSGAQFVAQQFLLTKDQIKEIYNVEIGDNACGYSEDGEKRDTTVTAAVAAGQDQKKFEKIMVYEIYSKKDKLVYHIADGYKKLLRPPAAPDVKIRRFWPIFALAFNEVESEKNIYPPSDVTLIRPMQLEYNRCREGLRGHRKANRPKVFVGKGKLTTEDRDRLMDHPENAVIEIEGMAPNEKIGDILQPYKGPTIEPQMYETQTVFDDVLHVTGSQEANLGGTNSATATQSSIAENSRISSIDSNVDDVDDMLNELMGATGEVIIMEMDVQTIKKICGVGAVWPEATREEVNGKLIAKIEAGSSGKPNRALEIANFEKLAPIMMQIPGISPEFMAKQAVRRLDDRLDPTDAMIDSLQSIIAMNSIQQSQAKSGGAASNGGKAPAASPEKNPEQQGAQGANNAPQPAGAPSGGVALPSIGVQ